MSFATQLISDEEVFFNTDEFAQEVTYGGIPINANVLFGDADTPADRSRDFQIGQARIEVKVSDVSEPAYRDAVVISGVNYRVQRIISKDEISSILGIETDERPELYG